jgi:hypothetical protein
VEQISEVREQVLEAIQFYRRYGFFKYYEGFTGPEIFADLAAKVNITEDFYSNTEYWDNPDFLLLFTDKERVLWVEPELGEPVSPGIYTNLLTGLAKISHGIFEPANIKETWDEKESYNPATPPTIQFDFKGQTFSAPIIWLGDWMDLGIIGSVNKIISPTGYRFEELKERNVENLFTLLTLPEKQGLEKGRHHQFNPEPGVYTRLEW